MIDYISATIYFPDALTSNGNLEFYTEDLKCMINKELNSQRDLVFPLQLNDTPNLFVKLHLFKDPQISLIPFEDPVVKKRIEDKIADPLIDRFFNKDVSNSFLEAPIGIINKLAVEGKHHESIYYEKIGGGTKFRVYGNLRGSPFGKVADIKKLPEELLKENYVSLINEIKGSNCPFVEGKTLGEALEKIVRVYELSDMLEKNKE